MTSDPINLGAGADPPPSGWCEEPYGPKANLYWDGSEWTTWLARSNEPPARPESNRRQISVRGSTRMQDPQLLRILAGDARLASSRRSRG